MQTFLDEVDASAAGMTWLKEVGLRHGAERIEMTVGEGDGGICGAWKGRTLIAYFIVVRDLRNWTVLVTHDLTSTLQARRRERNNEQLTSPVGKQYVLPFSTNLLVRGEEASIESELARELAEQATSPLENARVVGVIEGIEQMLLSLARAGVDLSRPDIAWSLTDCIQRQKGEGGAKLPPRGR